MGLALQAIQQGKSSNLTRRRRTPGKTRSLGRSVTAGTLEFRARQRAPRPVPETSDGTPLTYWLNVSSGVRHNSTCEHFGQTKRGRSCGPDEESPVGSAAGENPINFEILVAPEVTNIMKEQDLFRYFESKLPAGEVQYDASRTRHC